MLKRLVPADMRKLDGGVILDAPVPWQTDWLLDNLGNWSGGDALSGSVTETGDFDFDDVADPNRFTHHDVNAANEVETLTADAGSGSSSTAFVHDIVGNLVFDGVYWYQYDGWNRLMQVNDAGSLTADDFDARRQRLPDPARSERPQRSQRSERPQHRRRGRRSGWAVRFRQAM